MFSDNGRRATDASWPKNGPVPACPTATTGRRPWYYNWARRAILFLLVPYLVVVVVMMSLENSLIFIPQNFDSDDWHAAGLPVEDAEFKAADGTRLHGWYLAHPRPKAVVLFCHGNAGNVTHRVHVLRAIHEQVGASVLVFDYRGYGRSEGSPDERGVLADARAARSWLAARGKIAEDRIVLMGESIGGAVAVDLAPDGARALIVENTFCSMPDVAAYHLPWLPVRWLMRTRLNSARRIGEYHGPLLQSHGDCDRIVPMRFGQRLFEAANEPKVWLTYPGCDHNDPRPPEYYRKVAEFLDGCP